MPIGQGTGLSLGSSLTTSLQIDGITITELHQITDELGSVLHMLRSDAPDFVAFGECYFSEILPGAIKAWKQQPIQTQNLAVPIGRVRLVIHDDREQSVTRGHTQVIELGRPDAYIRVKIPPGLWYGFACISAAPALIANCPDRPHDPNDGGTRSADDSAIPYTWEGII